MFRLSRPEDSGGIPKVAAFHRKGWPLWIGTGGRIQSECPAAFKRISHYDEKFEKEHFIEKFIVTPSQAAVIVRQKFVGMDYGRKLTVNDGLEYKKRWMDSEVQYIVHKDSGKFKNTWAVVAMSSHFHILDGPHPPCYWICKQTGDIVR